MRKLNRRTLGAIGTCVAAGALAGAACSDGAGEDAPGVARSASTFKPQDPAATSHVPCEWAMFGQNPARTYSLPDECASPITPATAYSLKPKWTFDTPKPVTASPAVVGGSVYVGDWTGTMYALDAETGALRWSFVTEPAPGAAFGPIVSSAAVADVGGSRLVIFGAGPRVYALHAATGAPAWTLLIDPTTDTPVEVESSPVVFGGVVYVGMDTHNVAGTGHPGGLFALDAATGAILGKFEPELGADEGCGGLWSSPTIHASASPPLVYIATANCPRDNYVWTKHVEAVTALDATNFNVAWSYQPDPQNRKDHDFGAVPNLFQIDTAEGPRFVLGAGKKDAFYHALDANSGALLWKTKVAEPGDTHQDFSIGGFIGSPAVWQGQVVGGTAIGGPEYYHGLDGSSGALGWQAAHAPTYASSAAVNGVALNGALDGLLRAYDALTGATLWSWPLAGPISSGPAVVGNRVFVGSGTSSSDACAKDLPSNELCQALMDDTVSQLGAIHAFEAEPVQGADLALHRPSTCSVGDPAGHLVDGDDATATTGSSLSCVVDLGGTSALSSVRIRWGDYKYDLFPCNGPDVTTYRVSVSDDQNTWTEVASGSDFVNQEETVNAAVGTGRYVRLEAESVACNSGVGAYTFSVFGARLPELP